MFRVALLLQTSMLIVASIYDDEHIVERFEQPLGGIMQFTEEALQSKAAELRVESALNQLALQGTGCRNYKIMHIRSGSRQVVNGFIFEFVVEVESLPTEKCPGEEGGISEVYKIKIYEPAASDAEKRYTFEKLVTNEE